MADDVSIRIRLLDRLKFQRDAQLAQKSIDDIGDEARETSALLSTMGKVGSTAGRTALKGLKYAALGAAAVYAGVATGAITYANSQGEAINKANVVFGKHAQDIQEWSKTTAEGYGIARTEALSYSSGFQLMFTGSGVAEKQALGMSKTITQLAGDMASFHDQDPTEMLEKLRAGLSGEAEPLRQFGVNVSEANVALQAQKMGIAKVGEELTDAQKVQARFAFIMERTKTSTGDFGETVATSLPNALRQFKAEAKDTLAEVGENLLPTVAGALGKVGDAMGPALQAMGPTLDRIVTALAGVAGPLIQAALPILTMFGEVFALIAEALAPVLKALGPILQQTLQALMPGLRPVIMALGDGLLEIVKELGPVLPELAMAFADIAIALVPLIPVLVNVIKLLLKVGGPVILAMVKGIAWLVGGLEPLFGALERLTENWGTVWNGIKTLASNVWDAITAGIQGFVNAAIIGPINWVIDAINSLQVSIHIDPPGPGKIDFEWAGLDLPNLTPLGGTTSAASSVSAGSVNAPGRAMGGPMTAWRPYWTGEDGPELVVPRVNSTVIPNHQLDKHGGDGVGLNLGGGLTWYGDMHVHGSSDPEATADAVLRKLQGKAARR